MKGNEEERMSGSLIATSGRFYYFDRFVVRASALNPEGLKSLLRTFLPFKTAGNALLVVDFINFYRFVVRASALNPEAKTALTTNLFTRQNGWKCTTSGRFY